MSLNWSKCAKRFMILTVIWTLLPVTTYIIYLVQVNCVIKLYFHGNVGTVKRNVTGREVPVPGPSRAVFAMNNSSL